MSKKMFYLMTQLIRLSSRNLPPIIPGVRERNKLFINHLVYTFVLRDIPVSKKDNILFNDTVNTA